MDDQRTLEAQLSSSNPFTLVGDQEILSRNDRGRSDKTSQIENVQKGGVAEKSTFSSRMHATFSSDMVAAFRQKGHGGDPPHEKNQAAATALPPDLRHRDKENMAEFVAKKRDIFLVQMGLDTKRAEICKLEERSLQREEALKRSEQMLEEDALKFDAFLKENDEKVQEAIKKAEVEAKAKQDKVMEIKRLNAALAALRSELNKYDEQLEDFKKYKQFLDSITPSEWFEQLQRRKDARKAASLDHWRAQCDQIKQQKIDAAAAKVQAEQDYASARTQQEAEQAEKAIKDAIAHLKVVKKLKDPPLPVEDEEEEEEVYFKYPNQILELYTHLEEQNLFLIQNVQETEEGLEEMKSKYSESKSRLDSETESLKTQIRSLQLTISAEQEKQRMFKENTIQRVGEFRLGRGGGHSSSLEELNQKVLQMYELCGFDSDPSVRTLTMLTNMETKLEEYLSTATLIPAEFVETIEKAREKDRRQQAREEKIELQQREHEARVKRALERASAPVFKKTGKPVMFRSQPVKKKMVVQEDTDNSEDAELEAFLAKELLR